MLHLRVGPVLVMANGEVGAGAREQRPSARRGEVGTRAVVQAGAGGVGVGVRVGVRVRVRFGIRVRVRVLGSGLRY